MRIKKFTYGMPEYLAHYYKPSEIIFSINRLVAGFWRLGRMTIINELVVVAGQLGQVASSSISWDKMRTFTGSI